MTWPDGRRPRWCRLDAATLVAILALGAGSAPALATQGAWLDVVRNLRHPDADVRLRSVEQLGNAGYVAAIEPMAPLVGDPDDRVQFAAIDAELTFFLAEPIGGVRILGFGAPESRVQQAFEVGPFARASRPAPSVLLEHLLAAVRDENARIRFDAVHAIGVIGEAPVSQAFGAALAAELEHYDATIRAAVARVIGRLRVREAAGPLLVGLEDSSDVVRRFAIEALGWVGDERATAPLLRLVNGGGETGARALLALARLARPEAADLFRANVSNRDAAWRRAAVEGMGRLRMDGAGDTVAALAEDSSGEVRLAAVFAAHELGTEQSHVLASALGERTRAEQARDYLLELGPAATPGIRSALGVVTDSRHRVDLVHALGFVGTAEDIAVLEPLLSTGDERLARATGHAINRIRAREVR